MRLTDFNALSFDCYGTLIDWETGLIAALKPGLGGNQDWEVVLAAFGRYETDIQMASPALAYPAVLAQAFLRVAKEFGGDPSPTLAQHFGQSVGDWPAFADTPAALASLRRHDQLFILSNVDRESFARSNVRLGVAFDGVFTAQDIGSYKPARQNFAYLLSELKKRGIEREQVLHVAQSLYHDHAPAQMEGIATAWIDRRKGKPGGATAPAGQGTRYDFRFETLSALAEARQRAR
jgi:2-haloacid dehalogenase